MSWAQRLKRVFAVEIENCAGCGERLKVIASIEDEQLIAKVRRYLEGAAGAALSRIWRREGRGGRVLRAVRGMRP